MAYFYDESVEQFIDKRMITKRISDDNFLFNLFNFFKIVCF